MAAAYTKTAWVNGGAPAISAANLGKIESALENSIGLDTLDDLRALSIPTVILSATVLGHTTSSDGGGGVFRWDASSSAADNDGTIITPNSSPANGRWIRIYTDNVFHAAWFGMSTSATATNNTAAFNAAIAAAPASDGMEIVLPGGKLNVNTLTISKSGITVSGHATGTWLINNVASGPAVLIGGQGGKISWCILRGLRIGQVSGTTAITGNVGVEIKNTDQTTLKDITCWNFPGPLYDGFIFDDADNNRIENLMASNCLANGFEFIGGCTDTFGSSLLSYSNAGAGFVFGGASGFYANDLHGYGNGTHAFFFITNALSNQFFHVSGWIGDTSGNDNWLIQKLNRSIFSSCWLSTQQSSGTNTTASGAVITTADSFDITFNGCQFIFNNNNGALCTGGCNNIRFNGCLFGGTQGNGRSGSGSGIRIETVTDISVVNCRSYGNASTGIVLTGTSSDYILVQNNNLRGNTGASLANSSTGSNNLIGNNIL